MAKVTTIQSRDNKKFKELKKLTAVEGVKKTGKVIISGKKQVTEIARLFSSRCILIIVYDGYADADREIDALIKKFSAFGSLYILQKHLYHELDAFNTNAPLLVVHTPSIPEWDYSLAAGCNLLIPFQDPVNVGAVIRSAAGFGVKKIILLKEAAHPFHPRSIRASSGAVFKVDLFHGPSIDKMKSICDEQGLTIISLDMAGTPVESFQFPDRFLLLPGLEGQGVPDELKGSAISIPITDRIESLNAAIAASIVLFAWKLNIHTLSKQL